MITCPNCGERYLEHVRGLVGELGAVPITDEVDGPLEGAPAR